MGLMLAPICSIFDFGMGKLTPVGHDLVKIGHWTLPTLVFVLWSAMPQKRGGLGGTDTFTMPPDQVTPHNGGGGRKEWKDQ